MKKEILLYGAFIMFFCIGKNKLIGQDIHFSQYWNAPLIFNPALAGIISGDQRLSANYRSQWESVPASYRTFSAAYDTRLTSRKFKNGFFGLGTIFSYDRAGASKLSISQIGLIGSYSSRITKRNYLTLGVQWSMTQRSFNTGDLQFGKQYIPDQFFDPSRPSGENFDNTNFFYADLAIGVNWRYQNDNKRTKFDVGASIFDITEPNQEFMDGFIALKRRLNAYGLATIKVSQNIDVLGHVLTQLQQDYRETFFGAAVKIHLNQQKTKELAVEIGSYWRIDDSMSPALALYYQAWKIGFSYDINTSGFSKATNDKGGPEIAVIYTLTKVRPKGPIKTCPIY